jgi:hypothetical protein
MAGRKEAGSVILANNHVNKYLIIWLAVVKLLGLATWALGFLEFRNLTKPKVMRIHNIYIYIKLRKKGTNHINKDK